jgi:hypothetical protein
MKSSKNLAEIQKELQEAVKGVATASLSSIIAEKPPISIIDRLKIYQDAYWIRLLESLHEDFFRVREKVGDEGFKSLSVAFITQCPSRTTDLGLVSQGFPPFLASKAPELHELAVMDWLEINAYRAAFPPEESILTLPEIESGQSFLLKKYPASQVHKLREKSLLAFRKSDQVEVVAIDHNDFELISFLAEGRELEAVSQKSQELGCTPEDLQQKFSHWIKNEIIYCERREHV